MDKPTGDFPSTDAICAQIRNVLTNGPKTILDDVLVDFVRGYMKRSNLQTEIVPLGRLEVEVQP